jgi:hypothetical protein
MTTGDNQQERFRLIGWIVGFADGEGCFSVSIFRSTTSRFGYQVFPEFVLTQSERSKGALVQVQEYFGCGNIYINKRYDDHHEHLYRYCVRSIPHLQNIIVPFFRKYPLKTAKSNDFDRFEVIVNMLFYRKHLQISGFLTIIQIANQMNRKILRDYTADVLQKTKI